MARMSLFTFSQAHKLVLPIIRDCLISPPEYTLSHWDDIEHVKNEIKVIKWNPALCISVVLFFIFIFFTLYTISHLVNTTLHSYVNKCTTVLENKNIYLPRCSCGSYMDKYNTNRDIVGTGKTSFTSKYQISHESCTVGLMTWRRSNYTSR